MLSNPIENTENSYFNFYDLISKFLEKNFFKSDKQNKDIIFNKWKTLLNDYNNEVSKNNLSEQKLFLYFIYKHVPSKYVDYIDFEKITGLSNISNELKDITKHLLPFSMIYQVYFLARLTSEIIYKKIEKDNLILKIKEVFNFNKSSNINFFNYVNFAEYNYINAYNIITTIEKLPDEMIDISTDKIYKETSSNNPRYNEAFILFIYLIYIQFATPKQITNIKNKLISSPASTPIPASTPCPTHSPCPTPSPTPAPTPCPTQPSDKTNNLEFLNQNIYDSTVIQTDKNKYVKIYFTDKTSLYNSIYIIFL